MKNEIAEIGKFGDKYLTSKEGQQKMETKTWIDNSHVLMMTTDRESVVNILSNFEETEIKTSTTEGIKELQTAKAKFKSGYIKDILKLLTKIKSDSYIHIALGEDTPVTLSVDDEQGKLEITLAPCIED